MTWNMHGVLQEEVYGNIPTNFVEIYNFWSY